MRPRLKICGLMRESDVELCCGLGVDLCGFVTEYPLDVPWNLTRGECRKLLSWAAPHAKRCIVTGGSPEQVFNLARELRPAILDVMTGVEDEPGVKSRNKLAALVRILQGRLPNRGAQDQKDGVDCHTG